MRANLHLNKLRLILLFFIFCTLGLCAQQISVVQTDDRAFSNLQVTVNFSLSNAPIRASLYHGLFNKKFTDDLSVSHGQAGMGNLRLAGQQAGPAMLVIKKAEAGPMEQLQITLRFTVSGASCEANFRVGSFSNNVALALNAYGGKSDGHLWRGDFLKSLDHTVMINPTNVLVDDFQGWGTSLCWWGNVVGGYPNREAYADLAFKFLQLNIVRYNIGGGENPEGPGTLEYRARIPGFEPSRGVWNWQADQGQRWMLKAALARGVNHVEAFANSPPYWMTVSGSVTGAKDGGNNLKKDSEQDFAVYLAETIKNLGRLDNIAFHSITPMNEPAGNWWKFGRISEGCYMSADQQDRVIHLLRVELDRRHLTLPIDATEDCDEQSAINDLNSYSPAALGNIGQISTHTYGPNNPVALHALAHSLHKPLWHTEYGDADTTGLKTARRIRDDLVWLRPQAWCYWQFVDYDGWGLVFNPLDGKGVTAYTVTRKFYTVAQFSKFFRPGCKLLDCGDGNSVAAYDPAMSQLAIVAVNDSPADFTVGFDLASFSTATNTTVQCYRTSASENLKQFSNLKLSDQRLDSTLSANSVTTFVVRPVTPVVLARP